MTSLSSLVTVPGDVAFSDVDGETVLLKVDTGKYYGLDRVGSRMWALLSAHGCLEPAYQALAAEYAVAPETLERDLLAFVDKLSEAGLLVIGGRE